MNDLKLTHVVLKNDLGVTIKYEYKKHGLQSTKLKIPRMTDDEKIILYFDAGNEEQSPCEKTFAEIEKIVSDFNDMEADDTEAGDINNIIMQSLEISSDISFPHLEYEDITEFEIFGFDPITKNDLEDKNGGLWARHGKRKFKFSVYDSLCPTEGKWKSEHQFYFDKKDNEPIKKIDFTLEKIFIAAESDPTYVSLLDTEELGSVFTDNTHRYLLQGAVEFSYSTAIKKGYKITEIFPVKLILQNTTYYPREKESCTPLVKSARVSIDFGTSSTCIAVRKQGKIEMLALSPDNEEGDSVNRFENPTNIMVYDWDALYETWIRNAEEFPSFVKKGVYDEEQEKTHKVGFDFGYAVKGLLADIEKRQLNAIMTEIKMIPYFIDKGDQIEINPFVKGKKEVVYLTDDCNKQDNEHFDPIAFYGYLIGRVINNPAKGNFYCKYDITYPVKFNHSVREKMKKSLEYGLRLSLPSGLRTVRDNKDNPLFAIRMQYSEPEAYIGAICGRYLKCNDGPKMFAVYDFGGGTLDFSFGLFSPEEDDSARIDFLGVGGDEKLGGEFLISLISLWIISGDSNKGQIIEKKIPFKVPDGECIPGGFPENLFKGGQIARANMQKINEEFSRQLFEGKIDRPNDSKTVELNTLNGSTEIIDFSVDYAVLEDKLNEKIKKSIEDFKSALEENFKNPESESILKQHNVNFNIDDVYIFKSGNSSRSALVNRQMALLFPKNKIQLIDEVETQDKDMRYAITPKTAVAYGQLELGSFVVNQLKDPFKWYILKENKGAGEFKIVIRRNEKSKGWKKYGAVRDGVCKLSYSDKMDDDPRVELLDCSDYEDNSLVYIRIATETTIDYCIVENGESPSENMAESNFETIELGGK